jgi:hypothetical protein
MERVLYAVAEPVPTFDKAVVAEWAERRLVPECEVYTHRLGAFNALEDLGHAHTTVVAVGRREKNRDQERSLGECRAREHQALAVWRVPLEPAEEIRQVLSGKSGLALQPAVRALGATTTADGGHGGVRAALGAGALLDNELCVLRFDAN